MAGTKRKKADKDTTSSSKSKQAKIEETETVRAKRKIPLDSGVYYNFAGDATTDSDLLSVHVDDDDVAYDASLNQTNVNGNNNKFYRLQLLKNDHRDTFWVHTRWGRVGEDGQTKLIGPVDDVDSALKDFKKKFREKAGNTWENRFNSAPANKYTYLELNYDEDDASDGSDKDQAKPPSEAANEPEEPYEEPPSKLPEPTQQLIELIFNQSLINNAMTSVGYNYEKLPLGKLGQSTLKRGFECLRELANLINDPTTASTQHNMNYAQAIEMFTNRYYSTIPHQFPGRNRPPLIDHQAILEREVKMLDTLTDMEVTNLIMESTRKTKKQDEDPENILDKRFKQLNLLEMTPLKHSTKEFKEIQQYLVDSSGVTHGVSYNLQEVFRIERNGEANRFMEPDPGKLNIESSRLLLWHGSRMTNFGGILSQGLRIAPPEAPVNGYAFGKGIYMADCSSKSAQYCDIGYSNNTGCLLLCEAELGTPLYEIPTGDSLAETKCKAASSLSTKGTGRIVPSAWKDAKCIHKSLAGVKMPNGKPKDDPATQTAYLQYNEYIAYDVSQVRLRYLLQFQA